MEGAAKASAKTAQASKSNDPDFIKFTHSDMNHTYGAISVTKRSRRDQLNSARIYEVLGGGYLGDVHPIGSIQFAHST